MVAAAGSVSQLVTWRDPDSARLAYKVGVRAPVQLVVPDPAYALAPAPAEAARSFLADLGLSPTTRYLAVCPRPWLGRSRYLANLGSALERTAAAHDLEVLLVPFHEIQDVEVCGALAARPGFAGRAHSVSPIESPSLLAALLGGAELVVAMRLHSGILAAAAGSPAVIIDYDPKTRAFANQTGQGEWTVTVDDLESGSDSIAEAIDASLADLPARRKALGRTVSPLRDEAGRTAALAAQLARTAAVDGWTMLEGE